MQVFYKIFVRKTFLFFIFLFTFFTILFFGSCKDKKERFINTTTELLILQHRFPNDSSKREIEESIIYEKYDFTPQSYKKLYEQYKKDNQTFLIIMDTIKARIKQEILLIESQKK